MTRKNIHWDIYFPYIVTVLFILVSSLLIIRHELWSDEIKAWNIAIGSDSISAFLTNMRDNYGHPFLWNAILYFISHFITSNPESMKVVHLLLSTSTCFLFLKYAPFNKTIKVLFVFGYYPFFEYSIISRNYALGILPMILFCVFYKDKYKNLIPIAISLFFMGQAHIYTFLLSLLFLLLLIIDFISDRKIIFKTLSKTKLSFFFLIVISGIILLYWQLGSQIFGGNVWSPPIKDIFNEVLINYKQLSFKASESIVSAILPIPKFNLNFWNSNIIIDLLSNLNHYFILILAFILFVIPIFLIKKRYIFFYVLGYISLISIIVFIYGRAARHYGIIFIFLIVCLWISELNNNNTSIIKDCYRKKILNIFLICILSFSIIGSSVAAYYDFKYSFSSSKTVAEYIKGNYDLDKTTIVGYKDVDSQTIAAYLDKDIFFPQTKSFGRFCPWSKRSNDLTDKEIFSQAINFVNIKDKVLLITHCNAISSPDIPENHFFKKVNVLFENSIVGYENYCLYLFDKKDIIFYKISNDDNYRFAEFFNCKISPSKDRIIFNSNNDDLKLFQFPIKIEENQKYLIEFELNINEMLFDKIYVDFYGEGYDNPDQEFFIQPEEVKVGQSTKISKVLSVSNIPKNKVFFRIFSYSPIEGEIRNLNIYKLIPNYNL